MKNYKSFAIAILGIVSMVSICQAVPVEWVRQSDSPVLDTGGPSPYESYHVSNPSVLIQDGIYKMWYWGYRAGPSPRGGICYATSEDKGLTWTKHGTALEVTEDWEQNSPPDTYDQVGHPSVIYEGSMYKMWYSASGGSLGYVTSTDGINWDNKTQQLGLGYSYDNVVKGPSDYKLYYNKSGAIYVMESSDGGVSEPWEVANQDNPVLEPGAPGEWDSSGIGSPNVRYESETGKFQMWYYGDATSSVHRIGFALSDDGLTWEKDITNPVLEPVPGTWERGAVIPGSVVFDSSDSMYRMFYGGYRFDHWAIGSAAAVSEPACEFSDDFTGTSLDKSKWCIFIDALGQGQWPYVSSGFLHSQGYHTRIDSITAFAAPETGQSVIARARIRLAGELNKFGFAVNPSERTGPITGYYFDTVDVEGREHYIRALAWSNPGSGSEINLLDVEIPVTWYEFHEFAIERTPSEVIYSIDCQEVARVADTFAGALPVGVWNDRWSLMKTDWVEVNCEPVSIEVDIDIKPGSCPNPLDVKGKGTLPVAILGSENVNVTEIDVATILLEGVSPIRSALEDVATPVSADPRDYIAYWSFNNPCNPGHDDSGNGHDGTVNDAQSADGICGNALSFDGNGDYVEVPDDDALDPVSTQEITIAAWVSIPTYEAQNASHLFGIVGKTAIVRPRGSYLFGIQNDHVPEVGKLRLAIATGSDPGFQNVWSSSLVPTNQWVHVAVTHDIDNITNIYIDGQVDITDSSITQAFENNDKDLSIGYSGRYADYFYGSMDEVRIYNRALSASEITALAKPTCNGNECECTTEGPDGFLDLTLKFSTQEIVATLGEVNHGDELTLTLEGALLEEFCGTPIRGADCVTIRGKHKPLNVSDINRDGVVDMADFAIMSGSWLESSILQD